MLGAGTPLEVQWGCSGVCFGGSVVLFWGAVGALLGVLFWGYCGAK